MLRFLGDAAVGVVVLSTVHCSAAGGDAPLAPRQLFDQRIMPIFKSPNPSSCVQCHLAGVDLKNYILPSHEKTFLSLRDQGLIDLKDPARSKILTLIEMGGKDNNKGAAMIHAKTRQAEFDAFAAWIKASCNDPNLRDAPKLARSELAQPPRPGEVIRHARKDQLLESFENNIWAMRFRCMSCHIEGTAENNKFKKEFGERVAWIKAAGPEATMNFLLASKLIDVQTPEKSLLLRKPLMEVEHKGGKKFLPGDQGYKAFRAWLEDYARIAGDRYATAADLPRLRTDRKQFGTEIWFKLSNTPASWGDHLLQANIHAWNPKKRAWEESPIASSDRLVWGQGKAWQHTLTLWTPTDSEQAKEWRRREPVLPAGRYLVKVYVDAKDRLAGDWKKELDESDYVGQAEFTANWAKGYGRMTVVEASRVRR